MILNFTSLIWNVLNPKAKHISHCFKIMRYFNSQGGVLSRHAHNFISYVNSSDKKLQIVITILLLFVYRHLCIILAERSYVF